MRNPMVLNSITINVLPTVAFAAQMRIVSFASLSGLRVDNYLVVGVPGARELFLGVRKNFGMREQMS